MMRIYTYLLLGTLSLHSYVLKAHQSSALTLVLEQKYCPLLERFRPTVLDQTTETVLNTPVTLNVLTGATVLEGEIMLTECDQPGHGIVQFTPDGMTTYIPNRGFIGTDQFVYTGTATQGLSARGTVNVIVKEPRFDDDLIFPDPDLPDGGDVTLPDELQDNQALPLDEDLVPLNPDDPASNAAPDSVTGPETTLSDTMFPDEDLQGESVTLEQETASDEALTPEQELALHSEEIITPLGQ